MTTTDYSADQTWYFNAIASSDSQAVSIDQETGIVTYDGAIRSDESRAKPTTPEELVHATVIGLLCGDTFGYPVEALGHEIHFAHGSRGSLADEVDVIIYDKYGQPALRPLRVENRPRFRKRKTPRHPISTVRDGSPNWKPKTTCLCHRTATWAQAIITLHLHRLHQIQNFQCLA